MADPAPAQPVTLLVDHDARRVTLTLKGQANAPVEVAYELDVEGASTVRQKGRARLVPAGGEQLIRVSIDGDRPWRATLRVTADGHSFEEHRASE